MKFPPFFLLLAIIFIGGMSFRGWELWSRGQATYFICQLIQDRAIIEPKILKPWSKKCIQQSQDWKFFESRSSFFRRWQEELDQLKVSHLRLYTPAEQNELWTGISLHNGVQLEWADGHAMVVRIWPRSPAEVAGLKLGDKVLVSELSSIEKKAGTYKYVRNGKQQEVTLDPQDLQYSYPPKIHDMGRGIFRVEVNEFRTHGFSQAELKRLLKPLAGAQGVILDMRWNRGGNLVAGLRLAKFLTCQELDLGLLRKRKGQKKQMQMPDSLKDEDQLKVFAEAKEVLLKVKPESTCYGGPMVVLVNYSTASVAEIVTEGFRQRPKTKIFGGVTAGDALMGVWYDLDMLGDGSMVSIPEAIYQSPRGTRVEGVGVQPETKLFWETEWLEKGYDSWVKDSQDFLLLSTKRSN